MIGKCTQLSESKYVDIVYPGLANLCVCVSRSLLWISTYAQYCNRDMAIDLVACISTISKKYKQVDILS